tara:strand:- start:599 stop:829 length:231 start_codon:yes stop_codon:yes gene_type:complete
MIIPVKCFTCGEVLANKYNFYCQEVRKIKHTENINNEVLYLNETNNVKSPEGRVLDKLKLTNICCRRHMLSHVDIM